MHGSNNVVRIQTRKNIRRYDDFDRDMDIGRGRKQRAKNYWKQDRRDRYAIEED